MSRHALSDAQWKSLEDLLPRNAGAGRPWSNHRQVIDGILWVLATGAPWRDLPERFGPWKTVYERFRRWTQEGVWDRILDRLQARRHAEGAIDWELFCVDGSVVRAHKAAAGAGKKGGREEPADHALGRSQGGFGTKLHAVCDSQGWLIAIRISAGQVHESREFAALVAGIEVRSLRGPAKRRPAVLVGDKAYSAGHIRRWLRRRRIAEVIPRRENEGGRDGSFDRDAYRRRNIIERTIGWLKEFRRIATRYEKLATHYLGMLKLAMIFQYLTD